MTKERTREPIINKTLTNFLAFFGLENIDKYIDKIINYAKKDFEKFSAIIVMITTIGIWIIRALGYAYQSGKFSVYNIDKSYISLNDNFFLQIIQFITIGILFLVLNYIYFWIATPKVKGFVPCCKRILKILLLFLTEIILFISFLIVQIDYSFCDFGVEMASYSWSARIALISIISLLVLAINIFGIQLSFSHNKEKSITNANSSNDNSTNKKSVNSTYLFIALLIFISFISIFSYIFGIYGENSRSSYKVVQESLETETCENAIFKLQEEKQFSLYAIVYENEEIYILCQLYKSKDKIYINKDSQKIVTKDSLTTYNISNIDDPNEIYNILSLK